MTEVRTDQKPKWM